MGSIAARHARSVLQHVEQILAIELIVAAQALDLRLARDEAAGAIPGTGVVEAHRRIRARIGHLDGDREPGADLTAALDLVHLGALAELASPSRGADR